VSAENRTITYAAAINEALAQEMEKDPEVLLLGEDIGAGGGIFTVTKGLYDRFGPHRVVDTPISEATFVGIGAGAALAGLRPVVELMFSDFALVAADQLFNQVAKLQYLSGGELTVPFTLRTQQGIRNGGGSQHSQSLEALFVHLPGFAVAMPFTAADAKGHTAAAIRMNSPAVVIEHKALYFTRGEVPAGEHVVPFGHAAVRRHGTDVTLVSYSRAVQWCLDAAEVLAASRGIEADVIDLRTLAPLDFNTIERSIAKTHSVVVVHEASRTLGMGAELVARISEDCWDMLYSAPRRVAGLDIPIPYARSLEERWLPQVDSVVESATAVVAASAVRR